MRNVTVPLNQRRLNLPNPTIGAQPYQSAERCVVTQLVTDGQSPRMALGGFHDTNGTGNRVCKRLLAEDVSPSVKRGHRQLLVRRRWRSDGHEVNFRICNQVNGSLIAARHPKETAKRLKFFIHDVSRSDQARTAVDHRDRQGMLPGYQTCSDHANSNHRILDDRITARFSHMLDMNSSE